MIRGFLPPYLPTSNVQTESSVAQNGLVVIQSLDNNLPSIAISKSMNDGCLVLTGTQTQNLSIHVDASNLTDSFHCVIDATDVVGGGGLTVKIVSSKHNIVDFFTSGSGPAYTNEFTMNTVNPYRLFTNNGVIFTASATNLAKMSATG